MRFFVFLLFLVSLLSVSGCKQENPEITKLWEEYHNGQLEMRELAASDEFSLATGSPARLVVEKKRIIMEKIVEIDPDATFQHSTFFQKGRTDDIGTKVADYLEKLRSSESLAESQQRLKRLQDASDNFDRDMGN